MAASLRLGLRAAARLLERGSVPKPKAKSKAAAVSKKIRPGAQLVKPSSKGFVEGAELDKMNSLYLKALDAKPAAETDVSEDTKSTRHALAAEFTRQSWLRHNAVQHDMNAKIGSKLHALFSLPSDDLRRKALHVDIRQCTLPAAYRDMTETPPMEGWHRRRVTLAEKEMETADRFFREMVSQEREIGTGDAPASTEQLEDALGRKLEAHDEAKEKARRKALRTKK